MSATLTPQMISVPLDVLQAITEAAYWPVLFDRLCDAHLSDRKAKLETQARRAWLFECFSVAEVRARHRIKTCTPAAFAEELGTVLQEMKGLTPIEAKSRGEALLDALRGYSIPKTRKDAAGMTA